MRKMRGVNFHNGLAKDFILATLFFSLQEILAILYPMLLKNMVTQKIENDSGVMPELGTFLLSAAFILGLLIIIFFVSFYARRRVSIFGANCRRNARKMLYEKMSRVPTNTLYEYGTGKFLSTMIEDTTLVKYRNEQYLQAAIYFIVTILGSCIMMLLLSPVYVLFVLAAVSIEILIIWIYNLILNRRMPLAVAAYDKSFVATRESIAGARDIRILGKLPERTASATRQNRLLAREPYDIDQAKHTFECSNNIIFGIVTFGIILFGAVSMDQGHVAEQLVVINTIIQYITLVTTAAYNIFAMVINPMTRGRIAYQRIQNFLELPEENMDSGTTKIDTDFGTTLVLYHVTHSFWNGHRTINNLSCELTKGKMIAFCGEAGGGKTTLIKLLLRYLEPNTGVILLNGINIKDINKRYYRAKLISYCPTYPEFVPGTVRENIQLFNPNVTDEQILATFNEIGATNLAVLPSFLDAPLSVRSKMPANIKSLINIVRCILKPAEFYVFDRSFEHLSNDIVNGILKKLRNENKTCIFTTFNSRVCAGSDEVFFTKNDTHIRGTHADLFANNQDYEDFFMKAAQMEARKV